MNDKHTQDVLDKLAQLAPTVGDEPLPAHEALVELRRRLPADSTAPTISAGRLTLLKWRMQNMFKNQKIGRRLAVSVALVALMAVVFSFPGARALANDFLGLFRVEKFAPISISPEQIEKLQDLELEEGVFPGEFVWLQEPGEPQEFNSLSLATTNSGLRYLVEYNQVLGRPDKIAVSERGRGQLTVNLESSRQLLDAAGIDPTLLPDSLDGAEITATVPRAVYLHWAENDTMLIQALSPEVNYPDGFDPAPIGQAVLQLLGMDDEQAFRLAHNIDWTSTLILPIPSELASFSEVPVYETTGLLVTNLDGSGAFLMWQRNDRVYLLSNNGDSDALLSLIDN